MTFGVTPQQSAQKILGEIAAFSFVALVFGVTFGVTAAESGLSLAKTLGMSFMFAGAAQFAALTIAFAGGPISAAVAAVLLLNARYGLLGLAVADRIPMTTRRRFAAALFLGDPPVAMALSEPSLRHRERVYWMTATVTAVGWISGVAIGALVESGIGDPRAYGLDAALPVLMLAILAQSFRDWPNLLAVVCGATIGVMLIPIAPLGLPVLAGALGAIAPTVALMAVSRRSEAETPPMAPQDHGL